MKRESLEWYIQNWREECEACHKPIVVHAFRAKGKYRKAVYGSCQNKTCRRFGIEVCYYD